MAAAGPAAKAAGALRTIGEVAEATGVAPHVLRFWETRFPQLRPLQRAGNRRYYRAEDVALIARIDALLNREGYTIRGVQQVLGTPAAPPPPPPLPSPPPPADDRAALRAIRDRLAAALAAD